MHDREPDSDPSGESEKNSTKSLHLDLLGTFCLRQGSQPVTGLEHPRLQNLLAYLALHRRAPILRQQLAFLFWPDSSDQQAFKNLRTLLTRFRHALPDVDDYINITAQTIQWRPGAPFVTDVDAFETAVAKAEAKEAFKQDPGDYAGAVEALSAAVTLYKGELLPGCYSDWVLPLREQLHQTCGDALNQLVLLFEEHRKYSSALPYARRLLDHDSLHEAAYYHLIRLYIALGDRTEALRVYRACETMLEKEFADTLAPGVKALYERLIEPDDQTANVTWAQSSESGAFNLPLVGRTSEWSRLISAWHAASAGHPQMVLISGEAGVGKTRLAEELCAWVSRQGAKVALAHCHPSGSIAVAYAPVVEWLRNRSMQSHLSDLDDVWLVEIARIFPTLLAEHPHLQSPTYINEAWQRTRLFEALALAVFGSNTPAPVLLFMDDLQWCDQETLDWLGYLLRFAPRAPLLVVAAVRKYEIDRVHPLMAFWFALTRSGLLTEIPLSPLNETETGHLAANVAGRMMDADEAARIYQSSEGNPLFIVEAMRADRANEKADRERIMPIHEISEEQTGEREKNLASSFSIQSTPAAFPPKVRSVIQWRLAQLSEAARALAQTAAVIGREFHFEVLVHSCGLDEESVLAGLDELWQRHIVRVQGGSGYDFSHDGIRAVAYDEISPFRKRAVHLRVAQALEELHQNDLDAFSNQIAGHFEQAGQILPAISFYRRAASSAERVYANAAAARIYQHLLESELSTGLSKGEKCLVMLALAEIWRTTGQWVQAESISRKTLAEAEALGDIHLLAQAKCALADVLHQLGYYDLSLRWLAEAEQNFQSEGDIRGVAGTLRILGEIHWLRGDHSQAMSALERQLKLATEVNDPYGICAAQEAIGMVLWSQGDWELAADYCLKSIRIAGPLENKPVLTRASIILGNIRTGEHWFGEGVYWYQHAGVLARQIDDRQALSWATYSIAQILAKRGDDESAIAGFEGSLRTAWEISDRWTACLNVAGIATVYEHLGKANDTEALYQLAIDLGSRLSIPSYLSGMLVGYSWFLLAQARVDEARTFYEKALAQISGIEGERLAGEDTRFKAQVLGIRLDYASGKYSDAEAAAKIHALMRCADTPLRQAALHYELWRLAPENGAARSAAGLYREEYAETWAAECRERYYELTGAMLSDPPPLPDVSDLIPDQEEIQELEPLLAKVRSLLE